MIFITGRTSVDPYFDDGIRAAIEIASSRSFASTSTYPPSCSLVSANGHP